MHNGAIFPGLRVLVVEDEALVGMMIVDMLERLGCTYVVVAAWPNEALRRLRDQSFDIAVLDINLNGKQSFPVAEELRRRGIPYLFSTGYEKVAPPERHAGAPLLQKPYTQDELASIIGQLLRIARLAE